MEKNKKKKLYRSWRSTTLTIF